MSAEITPERIAELEALFRGMHAAGYSPMLLGIACGLLEVVKSSRAEVQRLQRERDVAIDERNAWRSGDQDSRIEADRLRGEVKRLTEESRRSADVVVVPRDSLKTILRHAVGAISHEYNGLCPDLIEGPNVRDPTCRVCTAIDALRSSTNHDAQDAGEGR